MKIVEIRAFGLRGRTPEGGWSNELQPDDCVHTLIAVRTDDGPIGWGSVFTTDELVRASLSVLKPLTVVRRRERARTGARQREAPPEHFLVRTRRLGHAHDQRHRHRAVGHPRQGHRPAGGAISGRALPREGAALRFAADARAGPHGRRDSAGQGSGLSRVQNRMGGRSGAATGRSTRRSCARLARRSARNRC